nr:hypothetical protein BaRGS_016334 [Batillaria attramentaria]
MCAAILGAARDDDNVSTEAPVPALAEGTAAPEITRTYTLSVRDYDELRGYLAKHYKIMTRRSPDHFDEYSTTKSTLHLTKRLGSGQFAEVWLGLKMAIKWMAPEVLSYNKHSTKADVWSFGVVLTEIFTYGRSLMKACQSKEAFESVQSGYRMPRPEICPAEVYDVILSCWQTNAHSRPSFDFLNTFLHDYET